MFQVKLLIHHNVFAMRERDEIALNAGGIDEGMSIRAINNYHRVFARDPGPTPGTVICFLVLAVVLLGFHVQEHGGNYTGYLGN